ncbi:Putative invertase inhibitor [Triticum urartu]|uniref:Putative invertase inhibitor n=1 Tax=Triticum urartu TaxID=4572 RepID=M8ANG5_TRIUA|nr:putative invertase inhibitor [Triticum dicoccoides]XP_048533402.1 putative invertase inhibitor [Triticum urartu]XP_048533416.1 putative invertase inhibitor [Triticum urartu]EMS66625.1 Putative invertase inhibitor [Triticum urartu]
MRPLTYVFFLLLISSTSESSATTLEDTCKSFAAGHPSIGYNYCVKTFHADSASATADARGLAAIAAKIAGATANGTARRIAALCASEEDAGRRERLGVCAEVYSDAVDQLGEAAKDIARGEDKSTRDALTQLSAALDAPGTCEDAFGEADDASPLAAEDAEFRKLATIALGVTALLSPPPSAPGISD